MGPCIIVAILLLRNSQAIESTWRLSHVSRSWLQLLNRSVRYCESSVIDSDILVPVVAALSESLLVLVSLIKEYRFVVA